MTYRQRIWLTIGLSATFVLGVGVGVTGQIEHAKESTDSKHIMYEGTRTTPALVNHIANEVWNAQKYADWCGGYVQVIGTDVMVEGCDR